MDDTTRLIDTLQAQLHHLDAKVANYRRDVAAEFIKYAIALLADTDEATSAAVLGQVAHIIHGSEVEEEVLQAAAEGKIDAAIEERAAASELTQYQLEVEPIDSEGRMGMEDRGMVGSPEGEADERPRSPHARENEFLGVITPGFLPLLDQSVERRDSARGRTRGGTGSTSASDGTYSSESASATDSPSPSSPYHDQQPQSMATRLHGMLGAGLQGVQDLTIPRLPLPLTINAAAIQPQITATADTVLVKPEPRRRSTDESIHVASGGQSQSSSTPTSPRHGHSRQGSMSTPRSALRRSRSEGRNGSGKDTRHVRFEFAGVEFPTTSSPSVAEMSTMPGMATAQVVKDEDDDDDGGVGIGGAKAHTLSRSYFPPQGSLSNASYGSAATLNEEGPETEEVEDVDQMGESHRNTTTDDVDGLDLEPSLLGVDDMDEEPTPRRISSSQALRVLSRSRSSEDDGTAWEAVRAPPDGSASIPAADAPDTDDESDDDGIVLGGSRRNSGSNSSAGNRSPGTRSREDQEVTSDAEADGVLSEMAPLRPMKSAGSVVTNNSEKPAVPLDITSPSASPLEMPTGGEQKAVDAERADIPDNRPVSARPSDSPEERNVFPTKESSVGGVGAGRRASNESGENGNGKGNGERNGGAAKSPKSPRKTSFDLPSDSSADDDSADERDDGFFAFDDENASLPTSRLGSQSRRRAKQRRPSPDADDEDGDDAEDDASATTGEASPERNIPASLSAYATSPARPIPAPAPAPPPNPTASSLSNSLRQAAATGTPGAAGPPRMSGSYAPVIGSSLRNSYTPSTPTAALSGGATVPARYAIGSYSGSYHPFQSPVVNPDLHEEVRGMEVDSFVGSISGATGLDEEFNAGEWRGACGIPGGQKRRRRRRSGGVEGEGEEGGGGMSFSERFAREG